MAAVIMVAAGTMAATTKVIKTSVLAPTLDALKTVISTVATLAFINQVGKLAKAVMVSILNQALLLLATATIALEAIMAVATTVQVAI